MVDHHDRHPSSLVTEAVPEDITATPQVIPMKIQNKNRLFTRSSVDGRFGTPISFRKTAGRWMPS
jgi:hypothetical protein